MILRTKDNSKWHPVFLILPRLALFKFEDESDSHWCWLWGGGFERHRVYNYHHGKLWFYREAGE